jgi:recombination associated protein RdgC
VGFATTDRPPGPGLFSTHNRASLPASVAGYDSGRDPLFKNLIVYRIGPGWSASSTAAEAALAAASFIECAATQPMSCGWAPPRGVAHGPLLEIVGGQWLMALTIEQRVLPAAVVRRHTEQRIAQIERSTGRKPGKTQAKQLKDEAVLELLPRAFTKQAAIKVWLDPAQRLLMIDAASAAKADVIVTHLVKALDGLVLTPLNTALSPAAAMAQWLTDGAPPAAFSVDRECELKSADEAKSVVRYARHPLDTEEVREHIGAGKLPTRLALTWRGRVSLLLTETSQLKRIAFLDGVFKGAGARAADDAYDADTAIATGELGQMIPDLIDALGGEHESALALAA